MLKLRVLFAAVSAASCLALAAQAAPLSLNVKTGLWEMTTSGQTSGAPPIPPEMLAQLTPERRAKFEAAMAASLAKSNQSHVTKTCVTEKTLQHGFDPEENRGRHCTNTVLSSNAKVMELRQECTGREKTSGHIRFEAVSPELVNGTIDIVMSNGANTMTMKHVMHGKWLGADCGNLKRDN